MRALIFGRDGRVGQALLASAPAGTTIFAHGRETCDMTVADTVADIVRASRPELIFNCAAYTAVDRAEGEEDVALAINADAVGRLADAARAMSARLVHLSTDFVFDGRAGQPYSPAAPTAPLNAYGRTKAAGERLAGGGALIVRTSWVYAATGANFVRTMLAAMMQGQPVHAVHDQTSTPTYAPDLAAALWSIAAGAGGGGTYHYTDDGACSCYELAVEIQAQALAAGLVAAPVPILPIAASERGPGAARPAYSVLDKASTYALLGRRAPDWRSNVRRMIAQVRAHG